MHLKGVACVVTSYFLQKPLQVRGAWYVQGLFSLEMDNLIQ